MKEIKTDCCIVGGGPCGMMLGFMLARKGIDVVVIEKHKDFFRDFRGDTIHPSTMEVMHELGILQDFLKVKHDKVKKVEAVFGSEKVVLADFSHLNVHEPYVAFMPQWDFLNFLVRQASKFENFHLLMQTSIENLKKEDGEVTGIVADHNGEKFDISASLTVACDGRHSRVRELLGSKVDELGVPIDVLWFRISRKNSDPKSVLARVFKGRVMVMLDRTEYWQCAFVIPKDHFEEIKKEGIEDFKKSIVLVAPFLDERIDEIKSFDDLKLLTVSVNRMRKWYTGGLLFLGDAAHAMSPIGGVGINLAIQDAVATANIVGPKLRSGNVEVTDLEKVQKRREFPTKVVQNAQKYMQDRVITKFITSEELNPPFFMRIINSFPLLRRIPAHIIGMGVRHESVRF